MPIYKKCDIVNCIQLATVIPVVTVALSLKRSGTWIAPLTMPFNPVCGDHQSLTADDYFTAMDIRRIEFECKRRGMLQHWQMMRIRFMPLDWKPNHGDAMTMAQIVEFPGLDCKWTGNQQLRKR